MRLSRSVTSGAFKYSAASSRARLSALTFGTTSAILPIHMRYWPAAAAGLAETPPRVLLQRGANSTS